MYLKTQNSGVLVSIRII